jgi:uncharacterized membrane protein
MLPLLLLPHLHLLHLPHLHLQLLHLHLVVMVIPAIMPTMENVMNQHTATLAPIALTVVVVVVIPVAQISRTVALDGALNTAMAQPQSMAELHSRNIVVQHVVVLVVLVVLRAQRVPWLPLATTTEPNTAATVESQSVEWLIRQCAAKLVQDSSLNSTARRTTGRSQVSTSPH